MSIYMIRIAVHYFITMNKREINSLYYVAVLEPVLLTRQSFSVSIQFLLNHTNLFCNKVNEVS